MNPTTTIDSRLIWTNRVIYFFLAFGILLSLNLWLSDRLFPLSPVFDNLKIGSPFDGVLIGLLLVGIGLNFFLIRRVNTCLIVAMLIFILLLDQMRWQPWVYIYFLLLTPFVFKSDQDENHLVVSSIQLILPGVYTWSGLHKLNSNFVGYAKSIILKILKIESSFSGIIESTIQLIPYIEIVVGLALLFPRFRKFGVLGVIIIHLTILLLVGPFGANINSIVWPWSIAMICLVMLAFFRNNNKVIFFPKKNVKFVILNLVLFVLVWLLPSMNFFKLWDNYLSFSLYSGKINDFYIAVQQNELSKIDKQLHKYFAKIDGLQGGEIIDVQKWSMEELNVPFTGQGRVFKNVCKSFCVLNIQDDDLVFLEIRKNIKEVETSSITCKDLRNDN